MQGRYRVGHSVEEVFQETVPLAKAALLLSRYPWLRQLVFRGLSRAQGLLRTCSSSTWAGPVGTEFHL